MCPISSKRENNLLLAQNAGSVQLLMVKTDDIYRTIGSHFCGPTEKFRQVGREQVCPSCTWVLRPTPVQHLALLRAAFPAALGMNETRKGKCGDATPPAPPNSPLHCKLQEGSRFWLMRFLALLPPAHTPQTPPASARFNVLQFCPYLTNR